MARTLRTRIGRASPRYAVHLRGRDSTDFVWVNGRRATVRSAAVPFDDWAFRFGWGVFETIRLHRGHALFLGRHLDRLVQAAGTLLLIDRTGEQKARWHVEIADFLRAAKAREGVLNLYWTRGVSPRFVGTRIICLRPPRATQRQPLRLWTAPWRLEPTSPGVGIKTLSYFPYAFAGVCARQNRCDEAILLNTGNRVADGASSTIFHVRHGRLSTPALDEGALPGITRAVVFELAAACGITCRESRIRWSQLLSSDQVFVTSSLRGLAVVGQIDDQRFPGVPDRALSSLLRAYRERVSQETRGGGHLPERL